MTFDDAIRRAIKNIAKHGDTDVFPFPFETHVFHDEPEKVYDILKDIHDNFDVRRNERPPTSTPTLMQVGYTGFRWASQIEPFWNAYYLACVISLADQIEDTRLPTSDNTVFSYRYAWNEDKAKIFSDSTWVDYRKRAVELAHEHEYCIVTDISDFYPRIYHHRIENALERLPSTNGTPKRIMRLLNAFSKNVSYGLPIGGPASRTLAELALSSVDRILARKQIPFCRYADDYTFFCSNKAEAHKILVLLSEKLFNEGLILQKNKTKIISASEFLENSNLIDLNSAPHPLSESQKLLNISVRYDPYSTTAEEDYEELKAAVGDIDIIGILATEIAKTRIDTTVTKRAISAIRVLESPQQTEAIRTLLEEENLHVLAPVFLNIMQTVRSLFDGLSDEEQERIDDNLIRLYDNESHLLSIDLHLAYFIQLLSKRRSERKEEILDEIYDRHPTPLLRRLIILTMANWGCHDWVSDVKQEYSGLSEWEKRSFILSSYSLGDEGSHWRTNTNRSWNNIERLIRDWRSTRLQTQPNLPI